LGDGPDGIVLLGGYPDFRAGVALGIDRRGRDLGSTYVDGDYVSDIVAP